MAKRPKQTHLTPAMDFNINYTVSVDQDINMFQRMHFEKLHALLRIDEDGNHLEKVDFAGCKLKNLDLSGLDLSHFDFSKSQLKNVNFSGCNLSKVILEKANLVGCNFQGAILRNCNLAHLKALECDFSGAILSGFMRWMTMDHCTFRNVSFAGGILSSTDFRSCEMENNTYEAIELSGLTFPDDRYLP
jgi:uncharacterized protein YjbI with pentapeptide repeats